MSAESDLPMADWLSEAFVHPDRIELSTGHIARPIRGSDVDIDHPAVMGSRERLWAIYGAAWGWPPATMTHQQDREDLDRHEREIAAHESFNYAIVDGAETTLLGCIYIDPSERAGYDAEISWWVVDDMAGSPLEAALATFVPDWIATRWPFANPFLGPP